MLLRLSVFLICWGIPPCLAAGPAKPAEKQIIHIGSSVTVKTLDPAHATDNNESNVLNHLFEGLARLSPFDSSIVPGCAKSWTVSADSRTYTFYLRSGLQWSDGTPITAHDFYWSWLRLLDPKTASERADSLYPIVNAEAYNKGKIRDRRAVGIRVLKPLVLEVTLTFPNPGFLHRVAFIMHYLPVPRHVVEKHQDRWIRPENIVSNGSFLVKELRLHQHIALKKNPRYWEQEKVGPSELVFHAVESVDTEEKMFQAGQLHVTATFPHIKLPKIRDFCTPESPPSCQAPVRLQPLLATNFYIFNTKRKPFDDARVRRALTLAIDREALTSGVAFGQVPAYRLTPKAVKDYRVGLTDEQLGNAGCQALARKLLADAGFPDGKGFPPFEILYNTSENHKKVALVVQSMWKKVLNIDVKLFNQEWKVMLDNRRKGNFDITRMGWVAGFPDPMTFLELFLTGRENNDSGWSHPTFDQLISKASAEKVLETRLAHFGLAEKLLIEEAPVIPLYFYVIANQVSPKLFNRQTDGTLSVWRSNEVDQRIFTRAVLMQ